MDKVLTLPSPWVHVPAGADDRSSALEATLGAGISDLATHAGNGLRSLLANGFEWITVRNNESGATVDLRMQLDDPLAGNWVVSSIAVQYVQGAPVTGALLKSLPVAAIAAAYSRRELEDTARESIDALVPASENPLAPLPRASAKPGFAARVARQYLAVQDKYPDTPNPIRIMMQINKGTPLSTMQRWAALARKLGMLPPSSARQGRPPSSVVGDE